MPLSLFTIPVKEYAHIRFDASDAAFVQITVWGFCIGAIFAALLSLYQQYVPGKLVRALLSVEALSADAAVTLASLGLADRPLIARELKHGAMLKKFVLCAEGEGEMRYYIPAEQKYRAATRYEKKGNALVSLAVTAVLSLALAVLLMKLIPVALTMVDAIL